MLRWISASGQPLLVGLLVGIIKYIRHGYNGPAMDQLQHITRWKTEMVATAAKPYRAAGRFAWHFARGKLGGDPAFFGLLQNGLIPAKSRILDLGCGQGLLAAWLAAADVVSSAGNWPQEFPPAPQVATYRGIELMPRDAQRAKVVTGNGISVEQGDIRTADFASADVVVILDVLHYMPLSAQDDVLNRVRRALEPAGTLLLRIGDSAGGWPFHLSNYVDSVVAIARGHKPGRLHCRTLRQWKSDLENLGFAVTTIPMSQGTPFANVLLVGKLGGAAV